MGTLGSRFGSVGTLGSSFGSVGTLGSSFGSAGAMGSSFKMTFASAGATPRPVAEPTKAPEVQAVEPKAPAKEQDSDQPGARAVTPLIRSTFFDDRFLWSYDKWTEGVKSKTRSPSVSAPAAQKAYLVNGVQVKSPVSSKKKKWESVEVCKPSEPRRLSRCWRRGGASKPASW